MLGKGGLGRTVARRVPCHATVWMKIRGATRRRSTTTDLSCQVPPFSLICSRSACGADFSKFGFEVLGSIKDFWAFFSDVFRVGFGGFWPSCTLSIPQTCFWSARAERHFSSATCTVSTGTPHTNCPVPSCPFGLLTWDSESMSPQPSFSKYGATVREKCVNPDLREILTGY